MYLLMQEFGMQERKLTTSFRCDSSIIKNVRWRAPDMKWRDDAAEGKVQVLRSWGETDVPEHSAVVCRNNAPLFATFVNLLQAGRRPVLSNKDVVHQIAKVLRSLGDESTPAEMVVDRLIPEWEKKARRTRKDDDGIYDRVMSMVAICGMFPTLGEAIDFLQDAASRRGDITLSTIHRAKGLEFDSVFILDAGLIREEGQDPNLKYVAETRAKHCLTYIESAGFVVV